jgi:cytochrome c5
MTTIIRSLTIPAVLALGTLLASCGGGSESDSTSSSASKPNVNANALRGAMVFKKTCASCHGADAKGMPDNGPNLHNNQFFQTNSDQQLFEYVLTGRIVEDGADMPPRGGFTEAILPDEDVKAALAYIRTFEGNAYTGP